MTRDPADVDSGRDRCSTILTGLLSFMVAEEMTTGSVKSTSAEKKHLASASHAWNL